MRALKYAKIDFMKMKKLWWAVVFPIGAAVALVVSPDSSPLFAFGYCLFAGIIFATFPFSGENVSENGFLQMLPAKPGTDVLGHFVFGLLSILVMFILSLFSILVAHLCNPAVNLDGMGALIPAVTGAAILFTGVEEIFLTVFRYEKARYLQLVRIVPAFVFLFGMNSVTDSLTPGQMDFAVPPAVGAAILFACLVLYVLLAAAAVRIARRR